MSETQGNNPVTGQAQPSEADKAKTADKDAAVKAAALAAIGKKADQRLDKVATAAETSIGVVLSAILECQEQTLEDGSKVEPWTTVLQANGKAYPSFQAYLAEKLSNRPHLKAAIGGRKLAAILIEHAKMSVKAAAKAADVSQGTASNAKGDVDKAKRGAQPGRESDTNGVAQSETLAAQRLAKQGLNLCARILEVGSVGYFSESDEQALEIKLREAHDKVGGWIKRRKELEAAAKSKASAKAAAAAAKAAEAAAKAAKAAAPAPVKPAPAPAAKAPAPAPAAAAS
jgi:hypothetical protein